MTQTREEIKECFIRDTENHSMEVLMDNGLYRHLKFTNNGSQCYRFDLHTWPGGLAVTGDMGSFIFSRTTDMFEFFGGGFNDKHAINPRYWAEKCTASNTSGRYDGDAIEEFSFDEFKRNVKHEYDTFAEDYLDADDEEVTEAYPEDTQSYKQMLEELWQAIEEEVLTVDHNEVRAYDAATNFEWESDDGRLKFDMYDSWEFDNKVFTYHYIWILYAIVWGIDKYNENKKQEPVMPENTTFKEYEIE